MYFHHYPISYEETQIVYLILLFFDYLKIELLFNLLK
jgi:hypothetical protein